MNEIIQRINEWLSTNAPLEAEDLSAFSTEQLEAVKIIAKGHFTTAEEAKDVTKARAAAAVGEAIKAEFARRSTVDDDLAALASAFADEPAPSDPPAASADPEPAPAPDPEPVSDPAPADPAPAAPPAEPPAAQATAPAAPEVTTEPAAPAAAAPAAPATLAVEPGSDFPDPSAPPAASTAPPVRLIASGDVEGYSAGTTMKPEDLGQAFSTKSSAFMRAKVPGKSGVAQLQWDYPDHRQLSSSNTAEMNTRIIEAAVQEAQNTTRENIEQILAAGTDYGKLRTLVAAGGLCAPLAVRYDLFTMGTERRPLRDSLTRFGATRGGIQYNAPPVLADLDGAVNVYTLQDDEDALVDGEVGAPYPKECIRVECGPLVTAEVNSVVLCMIVGQFMRMTNPERFQATWGLGRVAHARVAETKLWNDLVGLALDLDDTARNSATRGLLEVIGRNVEQYRDRHRIDFDVPLRVRMPSWLVTLMQIDLMWQAPGDDKLGVTRAEIARYLAGFNTAVTFVIDGQPAGQGGTYVQDDGAVNPFPTSADILISVDGTLLFLDLGRLDFGTEIRDFSLMRNNDSGAFFETFEGVANIGPDFHRISVTDICATGETTGPDVTITCTGS